MASSVTALENPSAIKMQRSEMFPTHLKNIKKGLRLDVFICAGAAIYMKRELGPSEGTPSCTRDLFTDKIVFQTIISMSAFSFSPTICHCKCESGECTVASHPRPLRRRPTEFTATFLPRSRAWCRFASSLNLASIEHLRTCG